SLRKPLTSGPGGVGAAGWLVIGISIREAWRCGRSKGAADQSWVVTCWQGLPGPERQQRVLRWGGEP
ncbi:MAG: hypothetical protein PVJ95_13705, partial [Cellvibrionales bacterium]